MARVEWSKSDSIGPTLINLIEGGSTNSKLEELTSISCSIHDFSEIISYDSIKSSC